MDHMWVFVYLDLADISMIYQGTAYKSKQMTNTLEADDIWK